MAVRGAARAGDLKGQKLLLEPRVSSEEDHIILLLGAEQGFELRLVELGLAVEHCAYLTTHGGWQCLAQL